MEGEFDRWFAALNGSDRNARGLSFGRTLAPRGAFDLGDTPVLQVKAERAAATCARPPPTATPARRSPAPRPRRPTSTPTPTCCRQEQIPLERGPVQAQIKVLASRTTVAFAPDAPLRFSQATEVDTRGDPDDVATVRLDTPVQQNQEYTVVSAVSTATVPGAARGRRGLSRVGPRALPATAAHACRGG